MAEALPRLDPAETIALFREKGWEISFDWRDMWQEEHARAFTVAKAMSRDLLEDIRAELDKALSEGLTLKQFSDALTPRLQARGWWGRKYMADPGGADGKGAGESKVVQLGSPARLRTIYDTNMRTSMATGRWQRIQRTKKLMPFLRYVSIMDGREREEHHAWHGTIRPVDDPWWDTHYPPCGWGCRCEPQPVNQRMMDRKGWQVDEPQRFPERDYVNKRTGEITRLERGIDPGWSYNVGKAALDGLTPAPRMSAARGEDGELQAQDFSQDFSEASFERVRGFFSAFGLASAETAIKGRVWIDLAGWPLAISAGLLRGPGGELTSIDARRSRELAIAAQILTAPERIAWIWVKGKDGLVMLVRRYRSAAGVVDMGGSFWRWHVGAARGLQQGTVIWTAEEGALQAYDPHQARHPKGSRDGGKFRSTGRGAALASLKQPGVPFFRTPLLGVVSTAAATRAASQGVEGLAGRGVTLEHTFGKHVMERHGPGRETRKDQRALTPKELINAHVAINAAHSFTRTDRPGQQFPRLHARSRMADGGEAQIFADIKGRNVSIVSMYVKKNG